MTSCAAQCLPDASAQVLDLIAEDEHELRTVSKCSIIKKAGCAVGVAAAIGSCGGPANIPCIISRLKALHGCGKWYLLPSSPTQPPLPIHALAHECHLHIISLNSFCQILKCRGLCKDFC
jgi:hypothetical protein